MKITPATRARRRAGLTLHQAAQRVKRRATTKPANAVRHLRRVELEGGADDLMGRQLAALYGCRDDLFFHTPEYWREWERLHGVDVVTGETLETGAAPVAGADGAVPMKARAFGAARGADTVRNRRAARRTFLKAV